MDGVKALNDEVVDVDYVLRASVNLFIVGWFSISTVFAFQLSTAACRANRAGTLPVRLYSEEITQI